MNAASNQIVVALCTVPDAESGERIAKAALRKRLAGCINLSAQMKSFYTWQGQVESSDELQLVFKTTRARLPELQAMVTSMHPYDLPEWLVISDIDGSNAYLKWIISSVE